MSTYLLAFQVGDWVCSKGEADGIPIRSCSTPDKLALTPYALHAAEHFLHYYDQYFGIKYAMPKLDMIGIPDFEAGAMENWGCITYRETDLLVDEKTGTLGARQGVAVTVAHEMAHQWFGDLVTMQWWDNVWLNEGFATWMESKAVDEWQPGWGTKDDEALGLNSTLNVDSALTTRAIRSRAETPAEISEQFDSISYGKAGAVLDMVEHYIGDETFRKGVHNYLEAHKYGNATAEDFWGTLTSTSGKPVDKIMSSFVAQPGVPLLRFTAGGNGKATVAQSRFFLAPDAPATQQSWTVPVCLKGSACQVITPTANTLTTRGGLPFANADAKGYYRSDFDATSLRKIIDAAPSLTAPERIDLIGDRLALMRAGQSSAGDYLDLVAALRNDANAGVLRQAYSGYGIIYDRVATDEQRTQLKAWIRRELGPAYAALGPAAAREDEKTRERRLLLFGALGSAGDPVVLAEASALTARYLQGDATLQPELAAGAEGIATSVGDSGLYDQVQQFAQTATDPEKKEHALISLAFFSDPELVRRTLDYATSGQVRNQDSWILIATEVSRRQTRRVAWDYIKSHWDAVHAQLTTASGGGVVSSVGSFCSAEDRADVQQFFATHKVEAADRALKSAVNNINTCIQFRNAQQTKLAQWLSANAQ